MTKEELHLLTKRFCIECGGVDGAYEGCAAICELHPLIMLPLDTFTKSELADAISGFCWQCLGDDVACDTDCPLAVFWREMLPTF